MYAHDCGNATSTISKGAPRCRCSLTSFSNLHPHSFSHPAAFRISGERWERGCERKIHQIRVHKAAGGFLNCNGYMHAFRAPALHCVFTNKGEVQAVDPNHCRDHWPINNIQSMTRNINAALNFSIFASFRSIIQVHVSPGSRIQYGQRLDRVKTAAVQWPKMDGKLKF